MLKFAVFGVAGCMVADNVVRGYPINHPLGGVISYHMSYALRCSCRKLRDDSYKKPL